MTNSTQNMPSASNRNSIVDSTLLSMSDGSERWELTWAEFAETNHDEPELVAEVRRQREEIARLRKALEPFAMKVNDGWNDNDVFHITSNPTLTGPTITAGNVRAAAKALEETK